MVFGYFAALNVVDEKYFNIHELTLLPVFIFLAVTPGSVKERFDILMGRISLLDLYSVYLSYILH